MSEADEFSNTSVDPLSAVVTFATDDDKTAAVNLHGTTIVGILMPATLLSTSIGAEASFDDGVTWKVVNDTAGTPFAMAVATFDLDQHHAVDPDTFRGLQIVRLTLNDNEIANRTFELSLAPNR